MAKYKKQNFNNVNGKKIAIINDADKNKKKTKMTGKQLKRIKQREELDRIVLKSKTKKPPNKLKFSANSACSSSVSNDQVHETRSSSSIKSPPLTLSAVKNQIFLKKNALKSKNLKIETDLSLSKQLPDQKMYSSRRNKNKKLLKEELGETVLKTKKRTKNKARPSVSSVLIDNEQLSLTNTTTQQPLQKSKSNANGNTKTIISKITYKNKLKKKSIKGNNHKIETNLSKQLPDTDLELYSSTMSKPILKINEVEEISPEKGTLTNYQEDETVAICSNYRKIKYFETEYSTKFHGVLLLTIGAEATISGKCRICVLKGNVNILGTHIKGSISSKLEETTLFSPTSSSLVTIKEISKNKENLSKAGQDFLRELLSKDDWKIVKDIDKFQGVTLIMKLEPSCVDFITKFKAYSDIFTSTPKVYKISDCVCPILSITQEWETTLEHLSTISQENQGRNGFIVLLCGSKNLGKSTFARCLVNNLLQRSPQVFFLECDVGQTEFTPPGIISLTSVNKAVIGPAFTHQQTPSIAQFFGDVTPKDNPDLYIRCIEKTFGIYQEKFGHQGPLVVNTMGWIKGLGLPLLIDVIRITKPSAVVQFSSNVDANKNISLITDDYIATQPGWAFSESQSVPENPTSNDYQEPRDSASTPVSGNSNTNGINTFEEGTSYIYIDGYEENNSHAARNPLKAADHRTMAMLTYFGKLFEQQQKEAGNDDNGSNSNNWIHRPIQYLVPYAVNWKDVAVHVMHTEIEPSKIMYALNCSVVCLAEVDPNLMTDCSEQFPSGLPKFLPELPIARYRGLGFIRNINPEKQLFYVLTPEPMSVLSEVNAFIKGNIDISSHLLTQDTHTPGPYKTWDNTSVMLGSQARKPRFNLRRRRLESPLDVNRHAKKRKSA